MEKAILVFVDGRGARLEDLMHPLFSDERLSKIARCQNERAQMDSACAELAYLVSLKLAFGEAKKNLYAYNDKNKPYFIDAKYGCLSFAHTGNVGACLIAPVGCGVDIECRERDVSRIETRIRFSMGRENTDILALWCAKESCVKLTGEGLARPFSKLCYKDNAIRDENGKHLAWAGTGEIQGLLWAVSLERKMDTAAIFLTAEEAIAQLNDSV